MCQVLYYARIHHGVAKGLKEVCQALERGEAQLVILAEDCDHEEYTKLVNALTADKGVYLIKVPEKAKLGDWAGQHKLDTDAKVKKTCKASCVAIKDFGEQVCAVSSRSPRLPPPAPLPSAPPALSDVARPPAMDAGKRVL